MSEPTLKEKTAKGLLWGGISNGVQQVLVVVFGVVLARVLDQNDYGIVGLLSIFMGIASTIQEGGFTAGLINRKEIKHEDYNSVFWFSFGIGSCMYIVLFFCAPLIAAFFNEPALVKLSRVLFIWFLVGSLGISHNALLVKELKVKQRAKIDIVSLIVSCVVGLLLVYFGYGYWGLAIQTVSHSIIATILRWYYSSWRPSLHFNIQPLKEMFPFSFRLVLSGFVNNINTNILSVFIGRFYTKYEMGDYYQGNKWASMGSSIIHNIVQGVTQSVLVEVHDDPGRQRNVFRKMLRFTAFISFPAMLGLALVAPELIVILITDKWVVSISILQIISIWGAFLPIQTLYTQLLFAHGKSNVYLWNMIAIGITQVTILFIVHSMGVMYMVGAFVAVNFIWLGVWQYWAKKLINLKLRQALKDILPYLLITFVVLGCSYFVSTFVDNIYLRCIVKILTAIFLYILIMWKSNSVIFKESVSFLLKRKNNAE